MRLAPDGKHIGFLHASADDSINMRLYIASTTDHLAYDIFQRISPFESSKEYEPPTSFEFAGRLDAVILQRKATGRAVLAHHNLAPGEKAHVFTWDSDNSAAAYTALREGDWTTLLVTKTSFIESALWQIINVPMASVEQTLFSGTKGGLKSGLNQDMTAELWFEGADGLCVHNLIIRPAKFDKGKKYAWVFMLHGGPMGDWSTGWSNRWNMAAWAEQGYVLIMPNFSRSTGYGLDFAKRINNEWGENPYHNIVHLVTNTLPKISYLDQNKGIVVGASYGGYMLSWLFSHNLSKRFCGAIWIDGIFSLPNFLLQSDVTTDTALFGQPSYPWVKGGEHLEKYKPASPERLVRWGECAPPTLVVHGKKGYRCPVTEGLAVFNTFQVQDIPSRRLLFEDEGHFVVRPGNKLVWYDTMLEWMRRRGNGEFNDIRRR